MSSTIVPIYYETSWSILSTIGLTNVLFGIIIAGIIGLSPVILVPLVVSAASAIANGLCYYAFYADYPITPTAVAAGFADFFWLIQEAGLSFYSYQILARILPRKDKKIFKSIFWFFILVICSIRGAIMFCRISDILQDTTIRIKLIDHLHTGYFLGIAFNEVLCSYFLLRMFFGARRGSKDLASNLGLFSYLTRSTEIRLTALALIGITRTITYSFQATAQSATNVAGQVDRFVLTLECVFPIIMYIDILAAKSIVRGGGTHSHYLNSQGRQDADMANKRNAGTPSGAFPLTSVKSWVDAGERSQSQEYIIDETGQSQSEDEIAAAKGAINKTVKFEFHTSTSPV